MQSAIEAFEDSEPYFNFINSLRSPETKKTSILITLKVGSRTPFLHFSHFCLRSILVISGR